MVGLKEGKERGGRGREEGGGRREGEGGGRGGEREYEEEEGGLDLICLVLGLAYVRRVGRAGGGREESWDVGMKTTYPFSLIPPADPTTGKLSTEMKYMFPPAVSLSMHKHTAHFTLNFSCFPLFIIWHKMP